jgi:D-alanine-D-alanine ligase
VKRRVAVVFGGRSAEHEISVLSARSVIDALDPDRYEVLAIGVTKEGRWELLPAGPPALPAGAPPEALADVAQGSGSEIALDQEPGAQALVSGDGSRTPIDVVFPVLHGPYGEDGSIQGFLEMAGVPYVGAGVLASAVGMDKVAMKDLFRAHNLPIVEYAVVRRHDLEREPGSIARDVASAIGYPCFVKPANLGSSVGISKVKGPEDLRAAIDLAARYDRRIIVERGIQAREVEVAVLGNDEPQVSVPGEVCFPGEWYDYDTKYGAGQTSLKIPAPLAPDVIAEVRALALRAFQATDCAGMARVDFFIENDRRVLVNEINTIPGFTSTSAYPRLWEASGIPYPELIARLIALALERR